jgi:hypothetical protein
MSRDRYSCPRKRVRGHDWDGLSYRKKLLGADNGIDAKLNSWQEAFFDGNGKAWLDIDTSHHGDSKKHTYAPHSHDWVNSIRDTNPRKPKKWEMPMVDDLVNKIKKSETKEESSQGVHFATVEDFIHDIKYGGETDIEYDGREYFVTGLYQAWEKTEARDGVYGEFKDVDEMLDNFRVHTGKTLREIATKFTVVCCHSDAKLLHDNGTEVPW